MGAATLDQVSQMPASSFDLSITLTVIIALCAVVSPIFVALINNRHQRKMRILEIEYEETVKRNELAYNRVALLFEKYLGALESCVKSYTNDTLEEYGAAFGNALLYVSSGTRTVMLDIDDIVQSSGPYEVQGEIRSDRIESLSLLLKNDLEEYNKH